MLRSTFRAKQTTLCWQRTCRDRFQQEGCPPVPSLVLREARVRTVTRRLAQQIIVKYEWLGTMASTTVHYGIFFGSFCAGVTCVGLRSGGANVLAHRLFGIPREALAYLARGACVHWAPPGCNSKLVSWTCRLLQQETSTKILIAYADTDAGEIGTIYQACNWLYIGCGESTLQWVAPTGRIYHKKLTDGLIKTRGKTGPYWIAHLLAQGWRRQYTNPKHRYVALLDQKDVGLRRRLEAMRQPYPKRATSIVADAPTVQAGESGSTPTVALIR